MTDGPEIRPEDDQPCEVCGNEVRTADGCFNCECPAPLDPDRLREDRDERRRMEREFPYAEDGDYHRYIWSTPDAE